MTNISSFRFGQNYMELLHGTECINHTVSKNYPTVGKQWKHGNIYLEARLEANLPLFQKRKCLRFYKNLDKFLCMILITSLSLFRSVSCSFKFVVKKFHIILGKTSTFHVFCHYATIPIRQTYYYCIPENLRSCFSGR